MGFNSGFKGLKKIMRQKFLDVTVHGTTVHTKIA